MSILQLDEFGQIVQSLPAMIGKLRFPNRNVSESAGDTHDVIVVQDKVRLEILHTERYESLEGYTRRRFFHLFFERDRFASDKFSFRTIPRFDAFSGRAEKLRCRDIVARVDTVDVNPFPIRWHVPYQMVPYFVGLPDADAILPLSLPDAFMVASWLEDYIDRIFDPIKAEQYSHGVRLLQTTLNPLPKGVAK